MSTRESKRGGFGARVAAACCMATALCLAQQPAPVQQQLPPAQAAPADPLQGLKQRAEASNGGSRAKLFSELAREELLVADQQFTSGAADAAQSRVASALEHATVATDAAVQSGKRLKETEIELRKLQRRTDELAHSVAFDDRPPVEAVVKQLEHLRSRLLQRMFSAKEKS